jgi:plasmid stabilization system protein ParE
LTVVLRWTRAAANDLRRLHYFLSVVNENAATRAVRLIASGAWRILEHPALGARLTRYAKRELRRIVVGRYEVRYAVSKGAVTILRVFHQRERR